MTSVTDVRLVRPAGEYKASFNEMLAAYRQAGEQRYSLFFTSGKPDLPLYLQRSSELESQTNAPEPAPLSTYWMIAGDDIVGVVRIRHRLTERNTEVGGHIGFDVPHAHRGKGYGTVLLDMALQMARELGISRALLTCTKGNVASEKIIERNGGKFENEVWWDKQGVVKKRYWISLDDQ
jgi:predicted acetyltransferase